MSRYNYSNVRHQLELLGYNNISDTIIDTFVNKLRLIEKEERKSDRKEEEENENEQVYENEQVNEQEQDELNKLKEYNIKHNLDDDTDEFIYIENQNKNYYQLQSHQNNTASKLTSPKSKTKPSSNRPILSSPPIRIPIHDALIVEDNLYDQLKDNNITSPQHKNRSNVNLSDYDHINLDDYNNYDENNENDENCHHYYNSRPHSSYGRLNHSSSQLNQSFILPVPTIKGRPLTSRPKNDPVTNYQRYSQEWKKTTQNKESSKTSYVNHVKTLMRLSQPKLKLKSHPIVPSKKEIPTDKKRFDVRWGIRERMINSK